MKSNKTSKNVRRKSDANSVKILRAKCVLEFGYYCNNTVAITAIRYSDGELWCVPTVNWEQNFEGKNYKQEMQFPVVVIKNHSENQGVYAELQQQGVILQGPYLSGTAGTIQVGILTPQWQAIALAQLKGIEEADS